MKKILAALVAFAMVFALAAMPSFAENAPVVFSADNVTAQPGDVVEVNVYLNGNYEAHVLNMRVNFDADLLTLNDAPTEGAVIAQARSNGAFIVLDHTTVEGSIRLGIMMPTNPFSASGTMLTLSFTVSENAPEGEIPVEIEVTEFKYMPLNGDSHVIDCTVENGSVTVELPATAEPTNAPTAEPTSAPTDEPTNEPTSAPTDAPVEPTEAPTDAPVDPTEAPTVPPIPPTGTIALAGAGVAAIVAGAGVVLFRRKEDR